MSDPYLDKLDQQRAQRIEQMARCPLCKANQSDTPVGDHIWDHGAPRLVPQSDATIEYDHDAPSEQYPYKTKGMTDGDKMSPQRWAKKGNDQ